MAQDHVPPVETQPLRPRLSTDTRALLGYLILAALFYLPLLLGLRTFPNGDFNQHFLPFSLFQRSEILAGRLPLWNPNTYAGHPFLADVQAGVFYPLSNLILGLSLPWADPGARLYWLQLEATLHLALAGFFTYLLARALTRNSGAAFLAGATFALSGYLTGYPPLQLAVLRTAIWLPLVMWLLWRAFETPERWRGWTGAALAYAVAFLAGHSQTFLFTSYAVAGWLVLLAWTRRGALSWGALAGRVVIFYGVFLSLSAAQLLPSLEFTRLSVRAATDYAFVSGGFPVRDTWQILLPGVRTLFSPLYVGIVGLGLALIGVTAAALRPTGVSYRAGAFFFAALALIALLVSYGANGFLYPLFYRFAPGWSLFRGQERAAYLVAFALSVLVAYGAAALDGLPRAQRARNVAVYAVAAVVGIALFYWFGQRTGHTAVTPHEFALRAAAALVLLAGFVVAARADLSRRGRHIALLTLIVADLFVANYATNLDGGTPAQKAALPPEAVATASAVAEAGPVNLGLPGRVYNEYRVYDDWGMLAGVEDVWGSSPLRLARYAALFDEFPLDRMWRLTGVGHVLTWRRELFAPGELLAEFPRETETTYLHRLPTLNPRAWVVDQARIAPDEEARQLLADGSFDLERIAVLPPSTDPDGGSVLPGEGPLVAPGQSVVHLTRLAPNRWVIDVDSQHGGLLVVSENWMPGWRATRDTGTLPVMRADLTLLGIPVRSGTTQIKLVYRPTSVMVGLALSAGTLALLALGWMWRRRAADGNRISGWQGPTDAQTKRLWMLALGGALLLGFGLRVWRLGAQELRGDEAFGYFFTQSPVAQLIRDTIALREPHPVGSYLLQGAWWSVAGHSEFALRFLSAWFGALSVALLYRLGRELGFKRATVTLGAALLAISPYAIWHSQDARMYSISMALTLASTVLFVAALRSGRLSLWAGYIGISWAALHVHYFAAFVLLAHGLYIFILAWIAKDARRNLLRWVGAMALLALLYLPWLIAARATLAGYRGNGDSPGFAAMLERAVSVFAVGETVPTGQRLWWAVLAGALLLIAAYRLARSGGEAHRALLLLALYLGAPVLVTWLSALNRPIFNERYLIAAAPPFYLLLAAAVLGYAELRPGLDAPRRLSFGAAALLALLGIGMLASLGRYDTEPAYSKTRGWRELAQAMRVEAGGADASRVRLAQSYPDPVLWYYTGPVAHLVLPPAANDAAAAQREVASLMEAGIERVVLAVQPDDSWDAQGIAQTALAGSYTLAGTQDVAGWQVETYARPPDALTALDATFENGVTLKGAAIQDEHLEPGELLIVYLMWGGDATGLTGSEKLTLQLLDETGALIAQTDTPFTASNLAADSAAQPRAYAITLPWELPQGAYRVIAALYDPEQEGAPRIKTRDGADAVTLTTVTTP